MPLLGLGVLGACLWGLACGLFERVFLAPRRRLSAFGPSYAPAMILAFFGGCLSLIDDNKVRFLFALLMASACFMLGALPAWVAFRASRWILKTRFSNDER